MSHWKWRETKQHPSRARSGHQINCSLVSISISLRHTGADPGRHVSISNWNLKWFFKPKLKPKCFLLNCHPAPRSSAASWGRSWSSRESGAGKRRGHRGGACLASCQPQAARPAAGSVPKSSWTSCPRNRGCRSAGARRPPEAPSPSSPPTTRAVSSSSLSC